LFPITAQKLGRDFGYGMPISQVLSSVALALCIFFYLYVVGSFLEISIYPLTNRVTSYAVFQEHVINEFFDNVVVIVAATSWLLFSVNSKHIRYPISVAYGTFGFILSAIGPYNQIFHIYAILSLPFIISIILYHYKQLPKKSILNFNANLTLRYISIAIIVISAISIAFSALSFFLAPHSDTFGVNSYSHELFLLLSSFSTVYVFLLIFCVPVKVVFRELLRTLKLKFREDVYQQASSSDNYGQNSGSILSTRTKISFLSLAIALSVILVLIPQDPSINKDNQDIGVDTHYYVTWIGELANSKSPSEFAYQAFVVQGQDGDRPLSLIVLFLVYQIAGGSLSDIIEYFPIILGPGIVMSLYFLTLELTRNEKTAIIAAFLGAISFHTLAGIYAGFYANWLALIVGYVSIVFLFRYLRSGRHSYIIVFSTLLVVVLFLHVYTWAMLTAITGIFLLTMLAVKKGKNNNNNNNIGSTNPFTYKRIIWLLLFAILLPIAIDLAKVLSTGSSGGLSQDIELAQTGLGIEQFNMRWEILHTTIHHSLGGVISSFIILTLGLIWVLKSNMTEPTTIFLIIFLSAGIIPLFFGTWAIQARVFYDMPLEIPAAIALYYMSNRLGNIVSIAACSWLVAVSLFTVMNYYLIPMAGMS
jgi:hypothetical protein